MILPSAPAQIRHVMVMKSAARKALMQAMKNALLLSALLALSVGPALAQKAGAFYEPRPVGEPCAGAAAIAAGAK